MSNVQIRRYTVGTEWVPVVAPLEANTVVWRNVGAVTLRFATTPDNDDEWDELAASGQEGITTPFRIEGENRFPKGSTVLWIRSASDSLSATVVFTWVR